MYSYHHSIEHERFGVYEFEKNNFSVEIWILAKIFLPDRETKYLYEENANTQNIKVFHNKAEYKNAMRYLDKKTIVISYIPYAISCYFIYRALTKYRVTYMLNSCCHVPSSEGSRQVYDSWWHFISAKLQGKFFLRCMEWVFRKMPGYLIGIRPANAALLGGIKTWGVHRPVGHRTLRWYLHEDDYERFLKENKTPCQVDESLCVFLDSYIPYHPDMSFMGASGSIDPQKYYRKLCCFFDYLEQTYHYHVVIAAHPRSRYHEHPDCFGGREVIKGKTVSLVRASGLVLGDASASTSFAVLYKKPIIFLMMDMLKPHKIYENSKKFAVALGTEILNLDNDFSHFDLTSKLHINRNAYKNYLENYIKVSGSPDTLFWESVLDKLHAGALG